MDPLGFVAWAFGAFCGLMLAFVLLSTSSQWHRGTPKIENCWSYTVKKGQPVISESHLKVYFGDKPAKLCLKVDQ